MDDFGEDEDDLRLHDTPPKHRGLFSLLGSLGREMQVRQIQVGGRFSRDDVPCLSVFGGCTGSCFCTSWTLTNKVERTRTLFYETHVW